MSARRVLVRLYPRDWRDRYAAEYLAVLEATPLRPGTLLDVLRGAADAHLCGPVVAGEDRSRRGFAVVLVAWAALCLAGAGFQKTVEDGWQPLQEQHALLGASIIVTAAAALVALAALCCAGLVILAATVRRVRGGDRTLWRTLAMPPACALCVLALLLVLGRVSRPDLGPRSPATHLTALALALVLLLATTGILAALLRLLHRAELRALELRIVTAAGRVATVAMLVVAMAIAAWALTLLAVAPQRFNGDGGILDTRLWPTVAGVVVISAGSALLAARSAVRTWRASVTV